MLAFARRTSAAVENCWRTPPMAFAVAPPAPSRTSARTTSRAPRSASCQAMLAPIAPAPQITMRGMAATVREGCARRPPRDVASQGMLAHTADRALEPAARRRLGPHHTPRPVVDLIVAACVRRAGARVLDPACGAGAFLTRAADRL